MNCLKIVKKIKRRNKLILIADTSEAVWDTVQLYESNPIANDSDDESRINKTDNKALRKRKLALFKKDGKAKSAHNNSAGRTFPSPFVNLEPAFKQT